MHFKWTLTKHLLLPLAVIFLMVTVGGTYVGLRMANHNAQIMVVEHLEDTSGVMGEVLARQESHMRAIAGSVAQAVELGVPDPSGEGMLPIEQYFAPALTSDELDSIQLLTSDGVPLMGVGPSPGLQDVDFGQAGRAIALSTMTISGDETWLVALAPVSQPNGQPQQLVMVGKRLDVDFLDSLANSPEMGVALTVNGVTTRSTIAGDLLGPNDAGSGLAPVDQPEVNLGSYGLLTSELASGLPGSAYLSVIVSTNDVTERVWTTTAKLVGVIWAAGLAAFVVLSITVRAVSAPIRRLATQAERIAEGDYGRTIPVKGIEEIRILKESFNRMSLALRKSYDDLSRVANTDALTGLYNHRRIQEALGREIVESKDSNKPVAVILVDIDDFKLFNATHGYSAGDKVLKLVSDTIRGLARNGDVVGRYGGDKFMIIAPRGNRRQASRLGERIRRKICLQGVRLESGEQLPLRLSIGVAVCPHDSVNKEELLAYLDASLFESKRAGGNAVTLANRRPGELYAYQSTTLGVLDGLVRAVDKKDRYTKSHSEENAEYAMMLGKALGLSEETQSALRIAGLLHDIGKIGIPDHILKKPGPLAPEEREIVQRHVVLSELIIKGVPHGSDVSAAVANHHERWDGQGYPRGLKGEKTPLLGRIMAVVDAYSAMTSDRPFRKAQSHRRAVFELRRHAGSQFDPQLVEVFIELMEARRREQAAA